MQVAKQNMPVSSIVIGVDLFPIKPVPGCIGLVEDITTDKCKQALTKELKTWKADVVLNDGAPNVGRNWLFDAYQQNCLSLSAVKVATNFLRPGGWFVTKVFRSKDYNAFVWVLKQLFKKVYATKPSASRKESAEIFVVCQGYKAPDKIDPKFMDPKYVFEELDIEPKNKLNLLKEPKKNKKEKAEGYDGVDTRKIFPASEFLKAETALDILQRATEIKIDLEEIENHRLTTDEMKECFKDIKVLGRKDLKEIIKWWKALKQELYPEEKPEEPAGTEEKPLNEGDIEEIELEEMEKHIQEMKVQEQQEEKRKKKKSNKERNKLEQKLALKMVIKGDSGPQEVHDDQIFSLKAIKNKKQLEALIDQAPDISTRRDRSEGDEFKPKFVRYTPDDLLDDPDSKPAKDSDDSDDSDEEIHDDMALDKSDNEEDDDDNWNLRKAPKNGVGAKELKIGDEKRNRNPLITDLDYRDKDSKRISKAELWFEKEAFKDLGKMDENDEDYDLNKMVRNYRNKGVEIVGENKVDLGDAGLGKKAKRRAKYTEEKSGEKSSSDSESDDENVPPEFEIVPKQKKIKLNEEELALGQLLVTSRKNKRDLTDTAWNRYMFNDEDLPEWFVEDEKKAMKKEAPVPKDLVENYKKNLQDFNTRSIKKVMEAKARKKRQSKKKMEKIKKKAENILENADNTGAEKIKMLKK
jgi:AdoMet-dependent rRNA methyltransferase SPB1